jgi:hypothetical protein
LYRLPISCQRLCKGRVQWVLIVVSHFRFSITQMEFAEA